MWTTCWCLEKWLCGWKCQDGFRSAEQHLQVPDVPEEQVSLTTGSATTGFVWEGKPNGLTWFTLEVPVQLLPSERDPKVSLIYSLSGDVGPWHFLHDKTHQRQASCLPLCLFTGCRQARMTSGSISSQAWPIRSNSLWVRVKKLYTKEPNSDA